MRRRVAPSEPWLNRRTLIVGISCFTLGLLASAAFRGHRAGDGRDHEACPTRGQEWGSLADGADGDRRGCPPCVCPPPDCPEHAGADAQSAISSFAFSDEPLAAVSVRAGDSVSAQTLRDALSDPAHSRYAPMKGSTALRAKGSGAAPPAPPTVPPGRSKVAAQRAEPVQASPTPVPDPPKPSRAAASELGRPYSVLSVEDSLREKAAQRRGAALEGQREWTRKEAAARRAAAKDPRVLAVVKRERERRAPAARTPPSPLPPLHRPFRYLTHDRVIGQAPIVKGHFEELGWREVDAADVGDCSEITFRDVLYITRLGAYDQGKQCYATHNPLQHITNHVLDVQEIDDKVRVHHNLAQFFAGIRARAYVPGLDLRDFYPANYALDRPEECVQFFEDHGKPGPDEVWVKKDSALISGKGIEFIRGGKYSDLMRVVGGPTCQNVRSGAAFSGNVSLMMQQYLHPYLIDGRKFDVRTYAYVASVDPLVVLWHRGPMRMCLAKYSLDTLNDEDARGAHVCNIGTARKHPLWRKRYGPDDVVKEQSTLERDLERRYPGQPVYSHLLTRMQKVMVAVIRACIGRTRAQPGQFELLAFDFMLDADLNLWFLEVQPTPGATFSKMRGIWRSIIDTQFDMLRSRREGHTFWPFRVRHTFEQQPLINEVEEGDSFEATQWALAGGDGADGAEGSDAYADDGSAARP